MTNTKITNTNTTHEITEDVIQAATENANGWVYKIEGNYAPDEAIPPEAIVGAWKVDAHGQLTGEFVANPKYQQGISTRNKPKN